VVAAVLFAAAAGFGATFAFGTEVEVPGTEDEVPGTPTLTAAAAFGAVVPIGKDDEVPGNDILAAPAVLAAPAA
jgi:hypothetical protein